MLSKYHTVELQTELLSVVQAGVELVVFQHREEVHRGHTADKRMRGQAGVQPASMMLAVGRGGP